MAARTAPEMKLGGSPVVAFPRAGTGPRAPWVRETSAPAAIDMPMPKLVVTNRIAPA